MTRLADHITLYFQENFNKAVTVEDIAAYLREEGVSVFSDTIRRTMSGDKNKFESIKTPNKCWRQWRLVEPPKLEL